MKSLLRKILFYSSSLFVTSLLLSGLQISGGVVAYVMAGLILTIMMFLLKPILQLISFPINALTFGLFSFVINAIILFLLTVFVPTMHVYPFTFPGLSLWGFATPSFFLNRLFAFLVVSLVLAGVYSLLTWVTTD